MSVETEELRSLEAGGEGSRPEAVGYEDEDRRIADRAYRLSRSHSFEC